MDLNDKKIAIVCDWLKDFGGAELVLSHLLEIFPNADIFTSVFYLQDKPFFKNRKIVTTYIQKIPFFNKRPKISVFLRPRAFEQLDFTGYDVVISSSSAESKGVITKPETLQICYCHTPTRYFWSHYHEYKSMLEFGWMNFIAKFLMSEMIHKLRQWDYLASQRPDYYIANSKNTAARISKYYGRKSEVIYPGIDTSMFVLEENKQDYYFAIGRTIPYKKFDLLVDAFNINGKKLIIVTNTKNKLALELQAKSKPNITWIFNIPYAENVGYYKNARAFLFPQEEDFGLVPIEAMSCGTPVIAYGKGGALETVKNGITGVFFDEQTPESLNYAIENFEQMNFDYKKIRERALGFDKTVFQEKIINFIEDKLDK